MLKEALKGPGVPALTTVQETLTEPKEEGKRRKMKLKMGILKKGGGGKTRVSRPKED